MVLKLDWDEHVTPYVDNAVYITIRTGRSRTYRNVMAGLGVRDPARAAGIQKDMEALVRKMSEKGGAALASPNIPEMVIVKFDNYEAVVVNGIIFTSVTLQGRLVGQYKLVIVMMDEIDACLTEEFKIEKYVQAALAEG